MSRVIVPRRPVSRLIAIATLLAALLMLSAGSPVRAATGYNWLQFDGSSIHSGNNTSESTITAANVSSLTKLWSVSLPAVADGAPAVLTGVSTTSGVHDLLYVTTTAGDLLALDAHTDATIWSVSHGSATCTINNNGSSPCYTTSSPAVGPARNFVFSYGLDGYIHRHRVGDGSEPLDSHWPELVTTKPFDEKESPALSIAATNGGGVYLYVGNGGYPGDAGDYQGHLTTINLSTGAQQVFDTLCSNAGNVHFQEKPAMPDCTDVQSAVWSRPGAIYDPSTNEVFISTGNGTYNPGKHDWGDSVLALNSNGTGANGNPLDSYTPANFQDLQNNDADLGSTAPAILPMPSTSTYQHVAVQSGKDGTLRLINLANLSGKGAPGHTGGTIRIPIPVPQGGEVLTQPAVWVNPADQSTWVFVANNSGTSALQVAVKNGIPSLKVRWKVGSGGTSPLIANGVLYVASSSLIQARNPVSGKVLWQNTGIGGIHWQSPVVANGILYIEDNSGNLTAFARPGTH